MASSLINNYNYLFKFIVIGDSSIKNTNTNKIKIS